MPNLPLVASALSLCGLLACASATTGEAPRRVIVEFTFESIRPQTARITPDTSVRWVNLAPDTEGFVLFPATSCSGDVGRHYRETAAGYQSLAVADFEPMDVGLPCRLSAGEHEYEILITGTGLGATDGGRAGHKLNGTLVVAPAATSTP
jgi:hypothetical protein